MIGYVAGLTLMVVAALQPAAETWTGRVVGAADGDTLRVRGEDDVVRKVRIFGIDAPEMAQPFGPAARDHLAKATRDRDVQVTELAEDDAGRTVARVRINGNDLAIDMLAAGLAWYQRDDVEDQALEAEERRARARTTGLWIDKEPIAPWEWRAAEAVRRKARKRPGPEPKSDTPPGR